MDLLLLLTSTLLSCYFQPGRGVSAQQVFIIRHITLSIEPSSTVTRDTNVTLRCSAVISSEGHDQFTREYRIYKDGDTIYNKTSRTSEDLVYHLQEARVSNSGKYTCSIRIRDQEKRSSDEKLTVKGLSKPVLHLNKNTEVSEGEEILATCTAPGETGSFVFVFYDGTREIADQNSHSSRAQAKLLFSTTGTHDVRCSYTVIIPRDTVKSEESDSVSVSVRELPIRAELTIVPQDNIYEGDQLNISCSVSSSLRRLDGVILSLSQGTRLFGMGNTTVSRTIIAQVSNHEEFECKVMMGKMEKVHIKTLSVTELFAKPTLTMTPAEVFQNEYITLTCSSESYARDRLREDELVYSLHPPEHHLSSGTSGVFSGRALTHDFNYSCVAQAKGVVKHSNIVTVYPKVAVSPPKIFVLDTPVLGRPIRVHCHSEYGSLPINYTLLKDSYALGVASVHRRALPATFTINITRSEDVKRLTCRAKNRRKGEEYSEHLNVTVIEPVQKPFVTVVPDLPDISEGSHLYIICRTSGTPPITFRLFREGDKRAVNMTSSYKNNIDFQIPALTKQHSGQYSCEVDNHANRPVSSDPVLIQVSLAKWKKAMIVGFSLLAVAVLVVVCVLYLRLRRAKVHKAEVSVWSKRPPEVDEVNDEESSEVSNEPDVEYTEVVHPQPVDPARVPLRKGTDTVYSELRDAPHGAADRHDYGSVEYAELNGEQPEINHYHPEVDAIPDLPVPVD